MFSKKQQILSIALSLMATLAFAQEREQDTLRPGVINVVKPYTPTISDAFKVKESPVLDDDETTSKKEIEYNIFSFPVASTFTPAKGKAAVVDKAKRVKLFNNYATLGAGSYTTLLGEVYLNHELSRDENISAYVGHHSSGGGIEDVLLDDNFMDSKLRLNYANRGRDFNWNVGGGFQFQNYNWYGIQQDLYTQTTADSLDVSHNYTNAHITGDIRFEDSYVDDVSVLFRRFGDDRGSGENRLTAKIGGAFPVADELISTVINFDYLSGSFERNYYTDTSIDYSNFLVGLTPTFQLKQDDLTVDIGVTATLLNNTEASESKFYIYPNIEASYRVVDDVVIAFGGIKGGLVQNSYYEYANLNPFVSPTLFIAPTDKQYDAFLGVKGMLTNTMSYMVSGSYKAERNKGLIVNNDLTASQEDYTYGNSFGVVYDNVNTFGFTGELNVDLNRNFTMGLKGEYFAYNTDNEAEAWNLPEIKVSILTDYQITEQWFAGANMFFVGERKDMFSVPNFTDASLSVSQVVDLESYFDLNAHVGYHVNDRLSVFAKGNNLVGGAYEKWQNTPVQGLQVLAGATYKFDF
ncbi:TonB-dependent receptor [Bizionia paragorgiae]|uniref:TonB-dependent receptor n=1 Tax=Bizionia paragorgiae TaxID=283786 RepID=UPI00299F1C53|nr:TonB-dependent receptor [Bizionia paragorgiae]MDX1271897.1 TonB-dependent receptor [Bizionia paragorgiae]